MRESGRISSIATDAVNVRSPPFDPSLPSLGLPASVPRGPRTAGRPSQTHAGVPAGSSASFLLAPSGLSRTRGGSRGTGRKRRWRDGSAGVEEGGRPKRRGRRVVRPEDLSLRTRLGRPAPFPAYSVLPSPPSSIRPSHSSSPSQRCFTTSTSEIAKDPAPSNNVAHDEVRSPVRTFVRTGMALSALALRAVRKERVRGSTALTSLPGDHLEILDDGRSARHLNFRPTSLPFC